MELGGRKERRPRMVEAWEAWESIPRLLLLLNLQPVMKPREYCCCAIPLINAGIYATLTEQFVVAIVVGTLSVATPSSKRSPHPVFSAVSPLPLSRRCCNSVVCPCPLGGLLLCSSGNPGSGLPGCRTSMWQALSPSLISSHKFAGKTNLVSQIRYSQHRRNHRGVCHRCCLGYHVWLWSLHRSIELRSHFLSV